MVDPFVTVSGAVSWATACAFDEREYGPDTAMCSRLLSRMENHRDAEGYG